MSEKASRGVPGSGKDSQKADRLAAALRENLKKRKDLKKKKNLARKGQLDSGNASVDERDGGAPDEDRDS